MIERYRSIKDSKKPDERAQRTHLMYYQFDTEKFGEVRDEKYGCRSKPRCGLKSTDT